MEFTQTQQEAIDEVLNWFHDDDSPQVFRLFGYAGTGKTTISNYIAGNLENYKVLFGAFTGKAASVMRGMGCHGATTIHSLIYYVRQKSKLHLRELEMELADLEKSLEELSVEEDVKAVKSQIADIKLAIENETAAVKSPGFTINPDSELQFADLFIVDEGSTINEKLAKDILSFKTKVLVMGDPKQLPPVYGEAFFMNVPPNVLLTEIHRQAKDNPIIQMATRIRNGQGLDIGTYGDSYVVKDRKDMKESLLSFDQIIVGTNKARHYINTKLRRAKGFTSPYPEVGDKLVCGRNNHDLGLLNGSIWMVDKVLSTDPYHCELEITSTENQSLTVKAHSAKFVGGNIDHWAIKEAEVFEYGYAITAHKAQGSQWENVLIVFDGLWSREQKEQWLYTAITRAIKRVVLCR